MIIKKNLTLVLIFCISLCFCQKHGKAYYIKKSSDAFERELDSLNRQHPNSPLKSLKKTINDLDFTLTFNSDIAVYKENETMGNDLDNSTSKELAKILSGYSGPTYYNFQDKRITFKKDIAGNIFLVTKQFSDYNWKLTKEKLIINNLTCYKAKTVITKEGRNGKIQALITAWYTTDISISAGPDGYAGLPGLIIQIEDGKFITVLDKIEFEKNKTLKIQYPKKGQKISENDFNALMKTFKNDRNARSN